VNAVPRLAPAGGTALRAVAAAAIGVVIVTAAAWRVSDSALFELRSLQVRGARHLDRHEVARLGGLGQSTNVLWLRPGRVAASIRADPWVLWVRVSRTLPSTITIAIKERAPVAELTGSPPLLVAADGVILGPARSRAALPSLDAASAHVVGGRLPASLPQLVVISTLPPGLRGLVAKVSVDPDTGIALWLRDGVRVLYGDASDPSAKGAAWEAVLSWARTHGVPPGSIDVRSPSAPALLPATGSTPGPPPPVDPQRPAAIGQRHL
jgi:cell division protein FtsQ